MSDGERRDPSRTSGVAEAEQPAGCPVTHETAGVTFAVPEGAAILDAALAQGIELDHGCRVGVCGACAVEVIDGAENLCEPDPIEIDTLQRHGAGPAVRLACRTCVRGPAKLRSA